MDLFSSLTMNMVLVLMSVSALCLFEQMSICLSGGVLFPVIFMVLLYGFVVLSNRFVSGSSWFWLSGWSSYVEMEIADASTSLRIVDLEVSRYLSSIYWFIYGWGLMLILQTLVHLFLPIGILSSMPYHLSYWLFGSALGLLLCVYVCAGTDFCLLPLDRGLRDNLFFVSSVLPSRLYYSSSVQGGVLNRTFIWPLYDIFGFTSLFRGVYPLLSWLYNISYFGVRLFLVFVLHSFCASCFGELYTSCCDQCMFISFPVGGLLGLGTALSLFMVAYLCIQIYVYISFSISFLFKTTLTYYRVDSQSYLDYRGPAYWLVPVSLVDVFPTHYFVWLSFWLMGTVIISRVWMLVSGNGSIYLKISHQSKGRLVRPLMR